MAAYSEQNSNSRRRKAAARRSSLTAGAPRYTLTGQTGVNSGRGGAKPVNQPNAVPAMEMNPRAGKTFQIGLTPDGRIVHVYSRGAGKKPQVINLGHGPRKGLGNPVPLAPTPAPSVLGTQPRQVPAGLQNRQAAAKRRTKPRTVTYSASVHSA